MLDEGYGYNNAQVEEIPDTMDISATNQTVELTRDGEVGAVEKVGGVVGVHNSQFWDVIYEFRCLSSKEFRANSFCFNKEFHFYEVT